MTNSNAPCPCGSGRKFRYCCGKASAPPKQANRPVRMVSESVARHTNEADRMLYIGRFPEAIEHCNQAIVENPDFGPAYFNRAMARFSLGQYPEMWQDFDRALTLEPSNAELWQRMKGIYIYFWDFIKAIEVSQKALELDPRNEAAWVSLAEGYTRIGNTQTARKIFEEALKRFPDNQTAKLQLAYMFSPIPESQEQMDAERAACIENLDHLMKEGFRLDQPERQAINFPFYHSYHGRNNVGIARKLAEFFYASCPSLKYTATHCAKPPAQKEKIRLGFISEFMTNAVLNQFWLDVLEGLAARGDFEVIVFSQTHAEHAALQAMHGKHMHKYVALHASLANSRDIIAREEIDILVFMEIGMAQMSYFLGMARLAPVQCLLGGHPITSGLPTIDYFFAPANMEPVNAQEHYTEKLVLLERNLAVFKRPEVPPNSLSRAELGLPEEGRLYCCPVLLFKIHPDMDRVFKEILERDKKAQIILFDSKHRLLWKASLQKRFALSMTPEQVERIHFLPFAEKEIFFHILQNVDCILDSFHFSFGTTAYLAIGADLPFVTWPGEFVRGRGAYGFYQQIGMMDLVAHTQKDYVELALKLANDKAFHAEMQRKIAACSHRLFDDVSVTDMFAGKLKELYAHAVEGSM